MKRGNLILMIALMFLLSLVVFAGLSQASPSQQVMLQVDQDRIEALRGELLSGEDKAEEAGGLTPKGLVYSFMQAYYQGERAMPPVDRSIASPVQAMMMVTSPVVIKRVAAQGDTRGAALLKAGKSDDEILEDLFLAALSRRPTADEAEVAKRVIAKSKKTGVENIQGALLNSTEFLVNHYSV